MVGVGDGVVGLVGRGGGVVGRVERVVGRGGGVVGRVERVVGRGGDGVQALWVGWRGWWVTVGKGCRGCGKALRKRPGCPVTLVTNTWVASDTKLLLSPNTLYSYTQL